MPFETFVTQRIGLEAASVGNDDLTQAQNCQKTGNVPHYSAQPLYRQRMRIGLEDLQARVTIYQQRAKEKADKVEKRKSSSRDSNQAQAADSITSPLNVSEDEVEFRDDMTESSEV
ncbi:uncharacterized protein N7498_000510 [Penicillium cinerascens]|uniref:Uncharacterized protein n=1 Tax=Penicillium cinerascens TaxID=70096 RepID=A0A9W9NEL7_9EURO|nr:uncharacterized protein N7498_000510 [Penicillium cinerascens]KAJ5218411.1 hypothetical protein N7498_000510 [Penicillium cinerascens]